ncbi:hypothetical protein DTO164E3_1660 [Paecilomyces variotii]|nr:hypothetical protein DTO032I3_9006 [Paecilomyces variotii]KAJ9205037.1 hypothetical protein DTO164E3_1660 [Paecilomyces variotii]KAJ9274752.1 hypothetical protein DTO021D3_8412 [Paecilomyces variotii]KAJ9339114.1 hypothetical protein DTO027B6_8366 [Paecilomyces variotii]KAJ9376313.1 hypothetical protein DTO032I4_8605 [Paecilomyces variotii]
MSSTSEGQFVLKNGGSPEKDISYIEDHISPSHDTKAEKLARTKADLSVLPLLFLGMTVFQLDRMNLASALTGSFMDVIHVNQNTINLGNQLMFLGIVVLEIPSNMLLQQIGPRKWIAAQVFVFGVIATFQIFLKSRAGFLVTRSLLGLAEAGYIPGSVYTLSTWYTRRELAKRVAFLFFGMFGGNAISPLLGAGLLRLDGRGGLSGWQWIFLIEGIWTISVSLLLLFVLPGSPDTPKPLLSKGLIRFSKEDQLVLCERLERDDEEKKGGARGSPIPLKIVLKTLLNYRRWPHYFATASVFATWSPLTTYTPTIIMALGFQRVQANALAAIGGFITLPVVFFFAWVSDRTNKRGLTVMAAITSYLIVLIVARIVHPHVGKWSRFGLWTAVNGMAVGYHPIHNTWVQLNCTDTRERSIAIAMWVMSAILGLMAGTQIFRKDDGPFYPTGLTIMIALVAFGLVMAAVQEVIYLALNHRTRSRGGRALYVP